MDKSLQRVSGFFLVLAGWVTVGSARADDTPPAPTEAYDLFHPVPDDQLRAFSTDRPTKSNSANTVDAGRFQYEADLVNWTYDRYNVQHVTGSNFIFADPVLKVGLTHNSDLEIAAAPFNYFNMTDRSAGSRSTQFGFGDITTRVKFNLLGNDGGDVAAAIVPYVKAPTASHSIGNGYWEGGAYLPVTIALPQDWSMTVQTEIDILENAANDGVHPNYQNLINVGHPLTPTVTGYVEFWSDVNADRDAPTQYTGDLALAWLVTPTLQLDGGVNLGLNKAAPDAQAYFGISQRF